ncbi:MAG TPA: J domain-containing protein [Miltoncostaeaceae bacterium]|nr:J domain-containing protein [Miltoncostaeaceae bacterium]
MDVTRAQRILGLPPDPTRQDVVGAWRRFARENHPDHRPGDAAATGRFVAGREAYETLREVAAASAGATSRPAANGEDATATTHAVHRPGVLRGAQAAAVTPYAFPAVGAREWRA